MQGLHKKIKSDALRALQDRWSIAIAICIIFSVVLVLFILLQNIFYQIIVVSNTFDFSQSLESFLNSQNEIPLMLELMTAMIVICGFLVVSPLKLGILKWYLSVARGQHHPFTTVFYFFSSAKLYRKSIFLSVNLLARNVFWFVVCMLPGLLVVNISYFVLYLSSVTVSTVFAKFCLVLGVLMILAGVFVALTIVLRYSLSYYLIARDDTLTIRECILLSARYTLGKRWEILRFIVSFLPFLLLVPLFLPILLIVPYFMSAFSIYALYLMEKGDRFNISAFKEEVFPFAEQEDYSDSSQWHHLNE